MNILLYVSAILILIATLNYSNYSYFRSYLSLQNSYTHYIQHVERLPLERGAHTLYKSVVVGTKAGSKGSSDPSASSKLALNMLLSPQLDNQNPAYQEMRTLFKALIKEMYSKQKFFEEQLAKRPNFIDQLVEELERASHEFNADQSKKAIDLGKIALHDSELQYAWYLILHGVPKIVEAKPEPKPTGVVLEVDEESETEENPAHAPDGYDSILENITMQSQARKIRVYLASRALLMAIYQNEQLVQEIINSREQIYKQIRNDKNLAEAATNQFTQQANTGQAIHYTNILDFSVSGTNPTNYK